MQITITQYNRIIQFLDGEMSATEMDAFENELDLFPAMRKQLNFENSIRNQLLINKNDSISNAQIKIESKGTIVFFTSRNIWKYAGVAASLIIGIITIYYISQKSTKNIVSKNVNDSIKLSQKDSLVINTKKENESTHKKTYAQIFEQYFKADQIPENYPMLLTEEFEAYKKGEYAKLQKLDLSTISESRGENSKKIILELGHYYKGISFLKTNKVDKAIANLKWILTNSQTDSISVKATWFLGLCYLKKGDLKKVELLLSKISTDDRYKTKIREIRSNF
jgi:tetratricopeptide (TPR) repeat protein